MNTHLISEIVQNIHYLKMLSDHEFSYISQYLRCKSFSYMGSGPPDIPSIRRWWFFDIFACKPIFRPQPTSNEGMIGPSLFVDRHM